MPLHEKRCRLQWLDAVRMKGSANAAWNGAVKPSGLIKKYGDRVKNRRGGAPEGAPAALKRQAGRLPKGAPLFCAVRRSASLRGGRRKTRAKARKEDKTG